MNKKSIDKIDIFTLEVNYIDFMKNIFNINNLEEFIVRYYIHTSVFDIIKIREDDDFALMNNKIICKEILKYLIAHEQSEVYVYSCHKIVDDYNTTNLSKIRIFRFIHDDINVLV